ncbi:MAG TPA: hypothetical protein VHL34_24155 [Rhizomicrobium sp.]|jgi:hypothetical protein|nr:hypothetical protein [Rhizomicrobium sp.]
MFRPLATAITLIALAGTPAFAATSSTTAPAPKAAHTMVAKTAAKPQAVKSVKVTKPAAGKHASIARSTKLASNTTIGHKTLKSHAGKGKVKTPAKSVG